MANEISKPKIYADLLLYHAYNWMQNYQNLNVIRYIEAHAGALFYVFIGEKGMETVINDLQTRIDQMMA